MDKVLLNQFTYDFTRSRVNAVYFYFIENTQF